MWITSAAVLTMITGLALVSPTPGHSFADLGNGGWGTMILIGLIASVAAFVVSGMAGAFTARLRRGLEFGEAIDEQLANYRRGLSMLSYVDAVLVVAAVATMASARFI
jgi:flagellar biosynthesis component FlhA